MFRYIIALLLINTYYSSLGMPPVPIRSSVSILLSTLEKNCTTPFLSTQINSKIQECSGVSNNKIQLIRCLIFYDINYQLCAAVNASKLALKADYSAHLNAAQNINTICNEAKDWVFTNISDYPQYKAIAEDVFTHEVECGQVCGTSDLGDSNEYCKYFKLGVNLLRNLLKSSSTTTTQIASVAEISPSIVVAAVNNDQKVDTTLIKDSNDLKVKQDSSSLEVKAKETSAKSILAKNDEAIIEDKVSPSVIGVSSSTIQQLPIAAEVNKVETSSSVTNPQKSLLVSGKTNGNEDENLNKLQNVNQNESKKGENGNQNELGKAQNGEVPNVQPNSEKVNDPVLEEPDAKDQGDTVLGSDGVDDTHYDTEDRADIKLEDEKKFDSAAPGSITGNKLPVDEIDTFGSKKGDYYSSTNQDVYSDDDDHFFTFFLITVIMVVLLYVLYHNKNKVSKVFFGLMVEGRQAGRRRNSRGHAYRRLDTLEQAMSGNATAPPSKIIY